MSDFSALMREVKVSGLLRRRRLYYLARVLVLVAAMAGVVVAVITIGDSWYQTLTAVALGVVLTQFAFLGHDAGHMQIFRRRWANDLAGIVLGDLVVGLSYGWWISEHNAHHANPNHVERDPDVADSVLAFTAEQVGARTGLARFVAKHEAPLFFPLLTLEGLNLHVSAIAHLLAKKRAKYRRLEIGLLSLHLALLVGLPLLVMWPVKALVFLAISQGVFGVYMGCSFAPNHKGMPMIEPGTNLDFLRRQVLTSRNVRGGRFVDVLLGGLNYQVEHHLFPNAPSPALRRLQPIVKAHCAELGVLYTETSLLTSYRIALQHMHDIGADVRASERPRSPVLVG